jgi:hypothetical protein
VAHRTHLAEVGSRVKPPPSPPATPVKSKPTTVSQETFTGESDSDEVLSSASRRPAKGKNVARDSPALGLLTPPASTRKPGTRARRHADLDDEESDQTVIKPLVSNKVLEHVPLTPDPVRMLH